MHLPSRTIIRHFEGGEVVAFVELFDPPCPPIGVYKVIRRDGLYLKRILPGFPELKPFRICSAVKVRDSDLEHAIIKDNKDEIMKEMPSIEVIDCDIEFKPEDYIRNIKGEYV